MKVYHGAKPRMERNRTADLLSLESKPLPTTAADPDPFQKQAESALYSRIQQATCQLSANRPKSADDFLSTPRVREHHQAKDPQPQRPNPLQKRKLARANPQPRQQNQNLNASRQQQQQLHRPARNLPLPQPKAHHPPHPHQAQTKPTLTTPIPAIADAAHLKNRITYSRRSRTASHPRT